MAALFLSFLDLSNNTYSIFSLSPSFSSLCSEVIAIPSLELFKQINPGNGFDPNTTLLQVEILLAWHMTSLFPAAAPNTPNADPQPSVKARKSHSDDGNPLLCSNNSLDSTQPVA